MPSIKDNLFEIQERIVSAAVRSGRTADSVQLIAVSKRVSADRILEAVAAGQRHFGENYVQEALQKITATPEDLVWHFIGHLQSNKADAVAGCFQMVETVDRLKLACALDRCLAAQGRNLDILIQVNIGLEPQKSGVLPENVESLLVAIKQCCRHLTVKGLMAIPPFFDDPEASRPYFRKMRLLLEDLKEKGVFHATAEQLELSMGMSGDYEVAIAEGSTQVRIGTAIFGCRS